LLGFDGAASPFGGGVGRTSPVSPAMADATELSDDCMGGRTVAATGTAAGVGGCGAGGFDAGTGRGTEGGDRVMTAAGGGAGGFIGRTGLGAVGAASGSTTDCTAGGAGGTAPYSRPRLSAICSINAPEMSGARARK